MRFLPILSLVAFTTIFPEFIVGRPLFTWLDPGVFIFLFIGYGLVILVLREFAVRLKLGLRGLILWGVAYGIINEGLTAKTFLLVKDLPVNLYDGYGMVGGIAWPWAAAISLWHAFAAVVFPILLIHTLFPKSRDEPWLGTKTVSILGVVLLLLLSFVFLHSDATVIGGTAGQLIVLLAIIAALFILGTLFKGKLRYETPASTLKPLLYGLSVIIPFWVLAISASQKLPVPLFFILYAGIIVLYAWLLGRNSILTLPSFLLFGIGWYGHNALQAFVILMTQSPPLAIITAILHGTALVLLFLRLRRLPSLA